MKKVNLTNCLKWTFLAFFFMTSVVNVSAKNFSVVVIDPGHGGHDLGASDGKVYEKHLALDTALRLEYCLKKWEYLQG